MMKTSLFLLLICVVSLSACTSSKNVTCGLLESSSEVLLVSDVDWEQLNPARGDKSPRAATLWGDRTGPGPAGFLLKPVDGFKSPPHIHNVAYRGVVISGLLHNDHPDAKMLWMRTGSFWTQPEGGVHITAAKGDDALAYIEVEDSFGVLPSEKAFDSRDKPINLEASKIKWVYIQEKPRSSSSPKIAFLWGSTSEDQLAGRLLMLPAGYAGEIHSHGSIFRAVVIKGASECQNEDERKLISLKPGSYISSIGKSVHRVKCGIEDDCVFYVRSNQKFDLVES